MRADDHTVSCEPEQGDAAHDPSSAPASGALGLAATAALALAACGGGGGSNGEGGGVEGGPAPPSYALDAADMAAARFLLQAQFGATDADIAAVRARGARAWLQEQIALPFDDRCWDWMSAAGYGTIDQFRFYDGHEYLVNFGIARQFATAPDGVRKRVALALSEMFVVSVLVANMPWTALGLAHYWDQLNANAFGNFRQLLEDVTLNPVMGAWLNARGNLKEDPATGRVPDENYAREVMQLFTIGLVQLKADGTARVDAAGNPLPTYTQDDVSQLARVFTGYDWWDDGRRFPGAIDGFPRWYPEYTRRAMVLDPAEHSELEVRFLGITIPAGTSGPEALRIALDTLFNHPNVGPFFARQMIQRLVTSNPSSAYVARVAAAFDDNGAGVRGDLAAVWTAILLDDEARGDASLASPSHGKLREPMVRVFQWARTFKVNSARGRWKWTYDFQNPMLWFGQHPFGAPSVFNFFRPGYVPPGIALARTGATAPEFQIVNESTVSQWVNFCEGMSINGMWVVWPDSPGYPDPYAGPYPGDGFDIAPDYGSEIALAHDPAALLRRLNLLLCAGQLSVPTQQKIGEILTDTAVISESSPADWKRHRVAAAVTLIMCSPEYLVQK